MANTPSDYSKFTITSKKDRYSHGYDIPDYERDMKTIVNQAVKSALSEGGYFKTSSRVVDKATGETKLDIYVHSADARVVESAIKTELNKLTFRDSNGRPTQRPKYKVDSDTLSDKEQRTLAREENKGDTETTRFNKSSLLKIIGVLTLISDITRRILSAVMTFSQQTVKDMVTAHNLGMSYESVRHYRHVETAHGMKEGTVTNAVADIQSKFGNITSLDEKALEALAVVMGSKIEDMAKMGMGASNPEAVLGAILDAFNEKANAGYNSVGQYVGEAQARRELYSYLLKVSPQVADIFATMQEEQHNINSIYRYQADTFEKFSNLRPTKRGGNEDIDYGVMDTLGETWNQLLEAVNQIKEAFIVGFAPVLLPLIRRLADTRVGMTAEEKAQRNKDNKEANERAIESTRKTMKYYEGIGIKNLSDEDRAYYEALAEYVEELESANKKRTVYNKVATTNELKLRGLANLSAVKEAKDNSGKMAVGLSSTLDSVTDEEIAEVATSFNYDTPEARAEFEAYVKSHNDKLPKVWAQEDEQTRKQEYKAKKKQAQDELVAEVADKNGITYKTRKKLGAFYRPWLDMLLRTYKTYGIDYDLSTWGNVEQELFTRLKELNQQGYLYKDQFGNYSEIFSPKFEQSQESKDKIRSTLPELDATDDSLFWNWLYKKYQYEMEDDIRDMRVSRAEGSYKKARTGDTLNILYDTEGTAFDWRKKVPKNLGDSAALYSVMDTSDGEKRLKFILEVKDGKKTIKTEVANILNGEGVDTALGSVTYDTDTKQPILNVNMADGASTYE